MGFGISFFPEDEGATKRALIEGYPAESYHRAQCSACPLACQADFRPTTPHMPPYGTKQPVIYMLGEAPGADEDAHGRPFVGKAGQFLRRYLPPDWERDLRWSNVVRTRPKDNVTPNDKAIECCRPSVQADIESTQPVALFGFGGTALHWVIKRKTISQWVGRRIPVQVGSHACWYFPMFHPSYVARLETDANHGDPVLRKRFEEARFLFDFNLRNAFAAIEAGLPEPLPHTRAMALNDIRVLDTVPAVDAALQALARDPEVGIDLETVGTRPYQPGARILSIALSGASGTYTFAIDHAQTPWTRRENDTIETMLHDWLVNAPCLKVQFTSFEMEWLAYWLGRAVLWSRWADAQGQAYLLDARQGTLSLEFLALQHFGLDIKALSNLDRSKLAQVDLNRLLPYNGCDARYHRHLYRQQSQLINQAGLDDVWDHHNRRIAAVVATQLNGIPINLATTRALHRDYTGRLHAVEATIQALPEVQAYNTTAPTFRPSANKDVLAVLQRLGHDLTKVEAEDLEKIDHPLAKALLQWRGAAKVLSTYILPLLPGADNCALMADGLLHPTLLVNRVRTWRSSSEDPNSQNFPKHGPGKEVRGQVAAPPGHRIVAFDFGQIQARNVAQESDDRALIDSMWTRHDIHADWRERIFELYPQWARPGLPQVRADKALLKDYRQRAKGFVFASFFGAGGKKVAEVLGIPEQIGYKLAEEFDAAFPGVAKWQDGLHAFYANNGYVTGLTGFRRYAPVAYAEIINTPIQSDEAMIVFDAMIRLAETGQPHFAPNMEIHDDLTFVWPDNKLDEYAEYVIGAMLNCSLDWAHKVPIVVEMSVGQTWDKMEPCGEYESDRWNGGASYKRTG
jgi:uracil-DNA glycosylase family 4